MVEREQVLTVSQIRQTITRSVNPSMTQYSFLSPHHLFVELIGELLSRGHSVRFRVNGKSMHPTINDGEMVTVEPVKPSVVKQGDIILYRNHKGLIAHRVVATAGGRVGGRLSAPLSPHYLFVLRGDASCSCDDPVEPSQILGKVVSVLRDGRSIELASRKAKIWHLVRVFASRLWRAMRDPFSEHLTLKRTILSRLDKIVENLPVLLARLTLSS